MRADKYYNSLCSRVVSSVGACGCFFVLSLSSLPSPKREEAWLDVSVESEESKKIMISKKRMETGKQGEKTKKRNSSHKRNSV